MKKDFRTLYDPFNTCSIDYNPTKVERINKELHDYYIPINKCLNCLVDYVDDPENKLSKEEKKFIKKDQRENPKKYGKPMCLKTICKLKYRDRGEGSSNPWVETRQLSKERYGSFLMARYTIVYNYYNNIPFILRTTSSTNKPNIGNGLIMHHKNKNPLDDRPENLEIVASGSHTGKHSSLRSLMIGLIQNTMKEKIELGIEDGKIKNLIINLDDSILNKSLKNGILAESYIDSLEKITNKLFRKTLEQQVNTYHNKFLNYSKQIVETEESLLDSVDLNLVISEVMSSIRKNEIFNKRF